MSSETLSRIFFFTAVAVVDLLVPWTTALCQEYWFSPPSLSTDHAKPTLAELSNPEDLKRVSAYAKVFSVPAHYLTNATQAEVSNFLSRIQDAHLKLDISMLSLEADKSVCDGEGVVWPGEPAQVVQKLIARDVQVYSFTLDLPLTEGAISNRPRACELKVRDLATRVAKTVSSLKKLYPNAKIYDAEVPTGMPLERWSAVLTDWLSEYRAASGANFDGLTMDVWYDGNWLETVLLTSTILQHNGISVGAYIDASAGSQMSPSQWVQAAETIRCLYESHKTSISFFVIANWLNPRVQNFPADNPSTLAALLATSAKPGYCSR